MILQETDLKTRQNMTHFRWIVVALSFIIIIINYMDRSAISYAIGPIKQEFGLNNADFGTIAAAFGLGYMVMTLGGGIFVDLWGARKVWTISGIAWSAVTALLGISSGLWMLAFFRFMLGITEGPCFPALTRVVADWLPMSERARSTAMGLSAVPLASVIGAPFISHLILSVGWKTMFFILGGLGVAWCLLFYAFFRDYPENSSFVSQAELTHIREGKVTSRQSSDEELRRHHLSFGRTTWKFMLTNPALIANNYAFFSFGYLLFFALTWLPGFLEQTYAVKLKDVGWFLIAPWATAFVLLALGGVISDYLWKRTGSIRIARSHMIWICQLLSALCFIPVTLIHSLPSALILISLGVGLGLMPNAAFYAINADLAKDRAATSLGLMDCFAATAAILAPYLTGYLSHVTGNFNSAIGLMVGLTLTSVIGVVLFQHPDRHMEQRESQ